MTDITSTPPQRSKSRRRGAEYWVYFTLIFVLSMPSATIRWVRDVMRQQTPEFAWTDGTRMGRSRQADTHHILGLT